MCNDKRKRYFLYSEDQKNFRKYFDRKIQRQYIPGEVYIDGKWKQFTEICKYDSFTNIRYSDAVIIGSGILSELQIKYPMSVKI